MGDEKVAPVATATPAKARPASRRPRVLAADDEEVVRDLMRRVLGSAGFEVETFRDGEGLVVAASARPPDAIVVDAVMPGGMNGFQVCRSLRENEATKNVPIMMVTGLTDYADRVYGIEAGADDYVAKPFRAEEVTARVRTLIARELVTGELLRAEDALSAMVRAIEQKAPHSERVARLSAALGEAVGKKPIEVQVLCRGGLFHDVGKIAVPLEILNKPGELSPEEFEVVKTHPERGWQMCRRIGPLRDALPAIRWHHERLDGSGYPDGLQGTQIPFIARVVAITSVFDALTATRAYVKAVPSDRAVEILGKEAQAGLWDKDLVRAFGDLVKMRGPSVAPTGWTGLEQGAWSPVEPPRPPSGMLRRAATTRLNRVDDVTRPPNRDASAF